MGVKQSLVAAAATLLLIGCGSDRARDSSAADESSGNLAAPVPQAATAPSAAAAPAPAAKAAAPVRYTLTAEGLAPGLRFGMAQSEVVKAASAALGAPTQREKNDECGEGPMDFVHFGDLQLGFQEGRFAGWSVSGPKPALHTAGGLAVGAPRSALGDAPIDEESSIGPEFDIGGVGGFLDDRDKIMSLWAGYPCQFR